MTSTLPELREFLKCVDESRREDERHVSCVGACIACVCFASHVCRFIDAIMWICAQNEVTTMYQFVLQQFEDVIFSEGCPGGRKTFLRAAVKVAQEKFGTPGGVSSAPTAGFGGLGNSAAECVALWNAALLCMFSSLFFQVANAGIGICVSLGSEGAQEGRGCGSGSCNEGGWFA